MASDFAASESQPPWPFQPRPQAGHSLPDEDEPQPPLYPPEGGPPSRRPTDDEGSIDEPQPQPPWVEGDEHSLGRSY